MHWISSRAAAIAWVCAVLAMAVHALLWWQRGAGLDTSILAMLPQSAASSWEARAREQAVSAAERRVLVLVGARDRGTAEAAADAVAGLLSAARMRPEQAATDYRAWREFYASYRHALLDADSRRALTDTEPAGLANAALARLYAPLPDSGGLGVAQDPFGLFGSWQRAQAARARLQAVDGRLVAEEDGVTWIALPRVLDGSPFERELQQRSVAAIASARELAGATPGTQFLAAGMVLHAAAAATTAQREISLIGSGSLAGIALLILLVFRSPALILVLQLPVLIGALAGFTATVLAFDRVHALTVVFGASLLGVGIDYPLHFASHVGHHAPLQQRRHTLRLLLPGMLIALASTVLAYLALAIAPFPGLRQMALFAGTGLVAAWLTVACWCPWLVRRGLHRDAMAVRALTAMQAGIARVPLRRRLLLLGLAVACAAPGLARLGANDDIRELQSSPPALLREQALVAGIAELPATGQYLLVRGADAAAVLAREESLGEGLLELQTRGLLGGHVALSQWVPSAERQAADRALLGQRVFAPGAALEQFAAAAGFDAGWVDGGRAAFAHADSQPLELGQWLAAPVSQPLRGQWLGCRAGECASIVLLHGIAGAQGLQALAALAQGRPGVEWVDTVANTSALLARYRTGMLEVLGVAAAAVALLLWWRMRAGALRVLAPPLLAGVLMLAGFGWSGVDLNLFVTLALALLLGMGIDYGVYLADPAGQRQAGIGITLAAMTTLLGFGLLAFSSTPALHLFGLTLAGGVSLAWLVANLTGLREPRPGEHFPWQETDPDGQRA